MNLLYVQIYLKKKNNGLFVEFKYLIFEINENYVFWLIVQIG